MTGDDVVTAIGDPSWSPDEQCVELALTLRSPDGRERPWRLRLHPPAALILAAELADFFQFGEAPPDEEGPGSVH